MERMEFFVNWVAKFGSIVNVLVSAQLSSAYLAGLTEDAYEQLRSVEEAVWSCDKCYSSKPRPKKPAARRPAK